MGIALRDLRFICLRASQKGFSRLREGSFGYDPVRYAGLK